MNLERSLQLGQGLDGHLVQGHVNGLATLKKVRKGAAKKGTGTANGAEPVPIFADEYVMEFSAGADLTDLMIPKGSVAVDGVSLTLVDVAADTFSVALIPTTLRETTLGDLTPGDRANIETDVIGKYVRKYLNGLSSAKGSITLEKLREEGFI